MTGSFLRDMVDPGSEDQLLDLDITKVHPDPENDRDDWDTSDTKAHVTETAKSIKAIGVRQPIIVKPHPDLNGEYMIVAGEVRYRASIKAEMKTIPAILRDDDLGSLDMFVENIRRKGLNSMAIARGLKKRLDNGMERAELKQAIGKSDAWISRRLVLLKMEPDMVSFAETGIVKDPDSLLELAKAEPKLRKRLIGKLEAGTTSIKDALNQVKESLAGPASPGGEGAGSGVAPGGEGAGSGVAPGGEGAGSGVAPGGDGTGSGVAPGGDGTVMVSLADIKLLLKRHMPELLQEGDSIADAWDLFLDDLKTEAGS